MHETTSQMKRVQKSMIPHKKAEGVSRATVRSITNYVLDALRPAHETVELLCTLLPTTFFIRLAGLMRVLNFVYVCNIHRLVSDRVPHSIRPPHGVIELHVLVQSSAVSPAAVLCADNQLLGVGSPAP